jgi:hypothetical protein
VAVLVAYTAAALNTWKGGDAAPTVQGAAAVPAVSGFITTSATGASVLMAAVGVLLGLGGAEHPLSDRAFTQLALTGVWLIASLLAGAFSATYMLTHVHHKGSVAENRYVLGCAMAQLGTLMFGGVSFVIGLFLL